MIELLGITRHLRNFLKAQVIGIGFFEWEDHMNETLAKLSDIRYAFSRSSNANHGFSRVYRYSAYLSVLFNKVME